MVKIVFAFIETNPKLPHSSRLACLANLHMRDSRLTMIFWRTNQVNTGIFQFWDRKTAKRSQRSRSGKGSGRCGRYKQLHPLVEILIDRDRLIAG